MTKTEVENYLAFMADDKNAYRCDNCPENRGFDDWPGTRLPCGQFHCWVCLHNEEEN